LYRFDNNLNDSSANPKPLMAQGSIAYSTSARIGSHALSLSGTAYTNTTSPSADFQFVTGDFGLGMWIFRTSATPATQGIVAISATPGGLSSSTTSIGMVAEGTGSIQMLAGADLGRTAAGAIPLNTWTYLAMSRQGSTFRLFVNGTLGRTAIASPTLNQNYIAIGAMTSTAFTFQGLIDDVRIFKGDAVFTGNFTPPSVDQTYSVPGTYSWVVPEGVTSVSVVCIGGGGGGNLTLSYRGGGGGGGLGWKNNIAVTPGSSITVVVGAGGSGGNGEQSYFMSPSTVSGDGGQYGQGTSFNAAGGGFVGDGGGNGGAGGAGVATGYRGGGGGAGGYAGNGGTGGTGSTSGTSGGGGGGGGGGAGQSGTSGSGGGVGLYGTGPNGAGGTTNGGGGGGGSYGTAGVYSATPAGGAFGGGGGGNGSGASGAVRIVWSSRTFPNAAAN
jgi:hypothetical protein